MGRGVIQTQFFKTPRPRTKNESRDNNCIAELERRLSQYEEQMNELLQAFRSQQSNTCGTSHASGSAVGGASNEPPTVSIAYSPPPPSAQFVKASARSHAPRMGASSPPPVRPLRASTPPPAPPLKASTPRPAPPLKASTPRPAPPLKASTPRPAPPLKASTPCPTPPLTASTSPTPAPSVTSKKKLKCNLHVEDRSMNKPPLVATGHVVIQPKLEKLRVDGKEYDDTYSCVFIEKIIKHNALLPQSLEQQGFRTVGEAIGCYVAWPRAYIVLEKSNQETVRPSKKARTDNPLGPPTQDLKHPLRPSKLSVTRYPKLGLKTTLKKLKTMVMGWPDIIKLIPRTHLTKSIYFGMNGRNSFSSSSLNPRNIEALKSYNIDGEFDK
ncbi:hypothetical protein G4B88_018068 [Cannabis sativa]|uniref:DUF8039 domain-containing protein n=1 Tax=Cannabis sativa TaxID=3483 RepID=A0A7J6FTN8_CANSA|nr:hypothetical protein G4B88_018068 [Cannabis sativa]